METTNEILDSTSHDCPLVTQTYSTAVAKGPHVPSSPTALGKGCGRAWKADRARPVGLVLPAVTLTGAARLPLAAGTGQGH